MRNTFVIAFFIFYSLSIDLSAQGLKINKQHLKYLKTEVEKETDPKRKCEFYNEICKEFRYINSPDSLEYYANKIIRIAIDNSLKREEGIAYKNFAQANDIDFDRLDSKLSQKNFHENVNRAIEILKSVGDKKNLADSYILYYKYSRKYSIGPFSLKPLYTALKLYTELNDRQGIGIGYSNLGQVYFIITKIDSAEFCYQKSKEIFEAIKDTFDLIALSNRYAALKMSQKKYDEQLQIMSNAYKLTKGSENFVMSAWTCNEYATALIANNKADEAFKILREANLNAKKVAYDRLSQIFMNMSKAYELKGDYKKAIRYKDSSDFYYQIYSRKLSNQALETQESNFKLESTKKEEQQRFYIIIMVAVSIGFVALIFIRLNQVKKKHNQNLEEKSKIIEDQNEELDRINQELEQRVVSRTNDLLESNEKLKSEITERNKAEELLNNSLKEKDILLKEIYHRTKNNMQVICSILGLQSSTINDQAAKSILLETENRIYAMSLVHQKLYQSKNLSKVNLKDYISDLVTQLLENYDSLTNRISLNMQLENVYVLIDTAVPLGLAINELITNSIKYAFPNNNPGTIEIKLQQSNIGEINLVVSDDGIGMNTHFEISKINTLGMKILFELIERQLRGSIRLNTEKGVKCFITFIDTLYSERV